MGRRSRDRQNGQFGGGQRMPQQVQINPDDLTNIECHNCNSVLFQQVYLLKEISAIMSPTGEDGIVPMPGPFACVKCGLVPKQLLPSEEEMEETLAARAARKEQNEGIITTDLS